MVKFTIKRKGYSTEEVDGFVAKLLELTEEKLREQKDRIDELKEQLRKVTAEKAELKAREASVTMALTEAVKRADELESAAEVRYSIELTRIKNIRKRVSDYLKDKKVPELEDFNNYLSGIVNELEETTRQLGVEDSLVSAPVEIQKEYEFDIQEALTPKETLEEICKELGLI